DAEREAPARDLAECEGRRGPRDRVARIERDDADAQPDACGGRPVRGEDEERVATQAVSEPDALVVQGLGAPGELHRGGEVAPGGQVGGTPRLSQDHRLASPAAAARTARITGSPRLRLRLARPLSRGSTIPPAESGERRGGAPVAGPRSRSAPGSAPSAAGPPPPFGGRDVDA